MPDYVHVCVASIFVACGQVYLLAAEGIAFRFLPDPAQVQHALKVQAVPLYLPEKYPGRRLYNSPAAGSWHAPGEQGEAVWPARLPLFFSVLSWLADHSIPDPVDKAREG